MLLRSAFLLIVLAALGLAGCGEDSREPECVAAIETMDGCGLDTSNFSCPDAGEADALATCGYPCFSSVTDCAEFSDPESAWGICLSDCIARYSAPPPEPSDGGLD